ncbi:MAG TPA: hypothetical protein VHK47_03205 [Polyangia bacterium]|jgi:hypothetical protein|nr:hypothetical protein [Polyangia bacterium]HVZ74144.1 hypothetical protein [Polyangia bacterium]
MPRPFLVILKACWALLAWVLFLSGVIGCTDGVGGDVATRTDTVAPDAAAPALFSSFERRTDSGTCQ